MKSLQESLFDGDLVSKDTGYEYLYGLIQEASVRTEWKVDYFDENKIKKEFNTTSKKFPPKDWSTSKYISMKKFQVTPQNEILRELLYVIAGNIKSTDIPFKSNGEIDDVKLEKILTDFIRKYINKSDKVVVLALEDNYHKNIYHVVINFYKDLTNNKLPGIACVIRFNFDVSILN